VNECPSGVSAFDFCMELMAVRLLSTRYCRFAMVLYSRGIGCKVNRTFRRHTFVTSRYYTQRVQLSIENRRVTSSFSLAFFRAIEVPDNLIFNLSSLELRYRLKITLNTTSCRFTCTSGCC
jgi:hypothetical protein